MGRRCAGGVRREGGPPISYCARRSRALRQFCSLAWASADFRSACFEAFACSCWRWRNACSCSAAVLGAVLLAAAAALSAGGTAGGGGGGNPGAAGKVAGPPPPFFFSGAGGRGFIVFSPAPPRFCAPPLR